MSLYFPKNALWTQGQFAIRSGWSAVKICHWSCCRGASLPLPPTHKSEHPTQQVEDSCFQQPFPPFASLSKVQEFYAVKKLKCTPFFFCLPFKPMGDFPQIFAGFLPHRQPTPKRRQVWSWILFAVPTGWSLSFPALCASLHLSHGLYPTSLWRADLYHQETHFFKKRRKMAFGSVLVFFLPKKNFVFLLGCIVFFWEWSVGRLGKIAMFRYVESIHFCDCSFRNLPAYSFKSHKTNKNSATHFVSFMYQGWVRIPSVWKISMLPATMVVVWLYHLAMKATNSSFWRRLPRKWKWKSMMAQVTRKTRWVCALGADTLKKGGWWYQIISWGNE